MFYIFFLIILSIFLGRTWFFYKGILWESIFEKYTFNSVAAMCILTWDFIDVGEQFMFESSTFSDRSVLNYNVHN